MHCKKRSFPISLLCFSACMALSGASAAQAGTSFTVLGSWSITNSPESLTVGDWNRDGSPDTACSASNGVTVHYNNGTGALTSSVLLAVAANQPDYLTSADVTGDTFPELIATDHPGGLVYVWRNNAGTFATTPSVYTVGPSCWNCTAADFNGDGWADIAVGVNTSPDSIAVLYNSRNPIAPFSTSGAGAFQSLPMRDPITSSGSTEPYALAPIDLMNDGRLDLAVTLTTGTQRVVLLRNQGLLANGTVNFAAPLAGVVTGNNPYSIAVGALDDNGHDDIVLALAQNISAPRLLVQVVLVNGLSLATPISYDIGIGSPRDVELIDVDNDGDRDIVVANRTGGSTFSVARLLNDGQGGFFVPGTLQTALAPIQINATGLANSNSCETIGVGDFDRDGRPDIVAGAIASAHGIRVLLNRNPLPWSTFGTGCPGSNGVPQLVLNSLAEIGRTYSFSVQNTPVAGGLFIAVAGWSRSFAGTLALPASLQGFGAPGCMAWCDATASVVLPHSGGRGTVALAIPNTTGLQGVAFFNQAWVLDPPTNPLGMTTSNAAEVVVM